MGNGSYIEECQVSFLTMARAKDLVPPEFIAGWKWFQDRANTVISNLPMGAYAPANLPLRLTRQAGIHSPRYPELQSKGAGKRKYVLSIHSGSARYDDKELFWREDGTWILDYRSQKAEVGRRGSPHFNEEMMNNLRDGIPVGVMVKQPQGGYLVCGLGFVEQYNHATDSFIVHGPVNERTEEEGFFSIIEPNELSTADIQALKDWDLKDERLRVRVEQIRRKGQDKFRKEIMAAYGGTCAITYVDVPEALQAAHIDSYRGPKSQVVNNGLLLRSDMHLLYDAHLFTVMPETYRIILSDRLISSDYRKYDGAHIAMPSERRLAPSDNLLNMHYEQFMVENRRA